MTTASNPTSGTGRHRVADAKRDLALMAGAEWLRKPKDDVRRASALVALEDWVLAEEDAGRLPR